MADMFMYLQIQVYSWSILHAQWLAIRMQFLGTLNGTTVNQTPGNETIEVTVSLGDSYAFVDLEYGSELGVATLGNIDVFKLHEPTSNISVSGILIGFRRLGFATVGTALSPDGCTLYAVSEQISPSSA